MHFVARAGVRRVSPGEILLRRHAVPEGALESAPADLFEVQATRQAWLNAHQALVASCRRSDRRAMAYELRRTFKSSRRDPRS
jgi:DNA-binding FadR family transcriptional regulator